MCGLCVAINGWGPGMGKQPWLQSMTSGTSLNLVSDLESGVALHPGILRR